MDQYVKFKMVDMDKILNQKIVCLTLDFEQDHGGLLDKPSYEGFCNIDPLLNFLKSRRIPLTCFVQGSLFDTHPEEVEKFSEIKTEYELHTYQHQEYQEIDHSFEIKKGRKSFKNYFGRDPLAYRSQAGIISDELFSILVKENFKFDSSIIPSIRPGVYNGIKCPVSPHFLCDSQILEFPVSVYSPFFRIPISLSYLKLLGKPYYNLLKISKLPNLIVFGFHLHDLQPLKASQQIPFEKFAFHHRMAFKRVYSNNGMNLFKTFIDMLLEREYSFLTLNNVYEKLVGQ